MATATDAVLTFGEQLPAVQKLVMYSAYLIGFCMAGTGLYQLATAGQSRGHASHGVGYGISLFLSGSLMLALVGTVATVLTSFFPGTNPEYVLSSVPRGSDTMRAWLTVILNILVILGWIASARGLMMLGNAGSRREKGLGAGVAHLIGGVLLTNPHVFIAMVGASFGASDTVNMILPPPP